MLSCFKVYMSEDVKEPLLETVYSGFITQGKKVEEFETSLKAFLHNPYALTVNSATAALTLGTRLVLDADPSVNWPGFDPATDVVLTPVLTCFATTASILGNRVNIRWVDVDIATGNISFEDLKKKMNKNTKIIYFVHWGGTPVDLDKVDELREWSLKEFGFKPYVVQDCAHAIGSLYKGQKLGALREGHIACFSTQAIKHLTTGDGGVITLPTEKLYDRCKLLRWYGIDRNKRNYKGKDFRLENDVEEWGYKFHMNDINATMGIHNLPHLPDMLSKHRKNAEYYFKNLEGIEGVECMLRAPGYVSSGEGVVDYSVGGSGDWPAVVSTSPKVTDGSVQYPSTMKGDTALDVAYKAGADYSAAGSLSAYWLFTVRIASKMAFIDFMKENNVMVTQVHNRNDINTCVKQFVEPLPNMDVLERQLICLPVGWWVTEEDTAKVVSLTKQFLEKLPKEEKILPSTGTPTN